MIIVCSDPGNLNPEGPLIEMDESFYVSGLIPRIKAFKTLFKVYLSESVKPINNVIL